MSALQSHPRTVCVLKHEGHRTVPLVFHYCQKILSAVRNSSTFELSIRSECVTSCRVTASIPRAPLARLRPDCGAGQSVRFPQMPDALPILVIAATARELAANLPCSTLICGVGPVESAARTAAAIARLHPMAVLHVGIAGARRGSGLGPGTIIVGSASLYTDLEGSRNLAPREVRPRADLIIAARHAVPTAVQLPIGTTGRVGGSLGCEVEAMEGFAVLRAAGIAGIPAVEVRAISNEIEEEDRARWHFDLAFAAITAVTPRLVEEIAACVS